MKKGQIITMWIAIILIAVIGTFFLAPLMSWKEMDEDDKYYYPESDPNETYEVAPSPIRLNYFTYCLSWWKVKRLKLAHKEDTVTYTGGTLDEITVTPNNK